MASCRRSSASFPSHLVARHRDHPLAAEGGAPAETTAVEGKLDHNETFVLQVGNPAALVNGANAHIDEWWPPQIPTQSIIAGAGQVRARGRLALFARANEV